MLAAVGVGLALTAAACGSSKASNIEGANHQNPTPGPAPTATSGTADSVTAAPVMVADTSDGAVGYREVGHGAPLVLIMGFGGTMQDWAPTFVDSLAANHRVVIFDNAGIGEPRRCPPRSRSTAMADQTSALIWTHSGSPAPTCSDGLWEA